MSNLITQADFARKIGMSKAHVTQLKQAGRLVMDTSSKKPMVNVEKSLARIGETKDPNRDDVTKRHAAARSEIAQPIPPDALTEKIGSSYSAARAVKERYAALSSKLAYEAEVGTKVEADEVKRAGVEAGTVVRSALDNLRAQIVPEIAPETDPARVDAIFADHLEHIQTELSHALEKLSHRDTEAQR